MLQVSTPVSLVPQGQHKVRSALLLLLVALYQCTCSYFSIFNSHFLFCDVYYTGIIFTQYAKFHRVLCVYSFQYYCYFSYKSTTVWANQIAGILYWFSDWLTRYDHRCTLPVCGDGGHSYGHYPFALFPGSVLKNWGGKSLVTLVRKAVDFYCIITLVINVEHSQCDLITCHMILVECIISSSSTSSWQLHSWGIQSSVVFCGVLLSSKHRLVKYGEWADHYTSTHIHRTCASSTHLKTTFHQLLRCSLFYLRIRTIWVENHSFFAVIYSAIWLVLPDSGATNWQLFPWMLQALSSLWDSLGTRPGCALILCRISWIKQLPFHKSQLVPWWPLCTRNTHVHNVRSYVLEMLWDIMNYAFATWKSRLGKIAMKVWKRALG